MRRPRLDTIVVVAPALASVAGFVDAVGYITLHGLFVAHMSGNTVKFGVYAGRGDLAVVAPVGFAVVVFVAGIAIGTIAAEVTSRRRHRSVAATVLGVQTALIAAFMLYGSTLLDGHEVRGHSLGGFYVLATLAVLSMGLQTAALRQLGGRAISTTYVTGVLTSLTQEATNYAFWLHDREHRDEEHSFLSRVLGLGSRHESRGRVLLLASVWLAYISGAVLGSYLDGPLELWALLLPLAVLVLVVLSDLSRPLVL